MKFKKSIVATVVAGTTLFGGGAAFAFVIATGNGHSQATVANPTFTMVVTPGTVSGLTPGAAGSALPVTVKNTSASKIQVNSVALSIPSTETCSGTITVTQPTVAATVLAAGATATFSGATLAMADSDTVDQTACMGASLTVNASVNGG